MGKNLKGKNCGKGICQRKDGLYYARFVNKAGKRYERYFQTLPEARNWIEDSKYAVTSICQFFTQLVLNIIFIVIMDMGANGVFVMGDCGLNQNPNPEQLADIAASSSSTLSEISL